MRDDRNVDPKDFSAAADPVERVPYLVDAVAAEFAAAVAAGIAASGVAESADDAEAAAVIAAPAGVVVVGGVLAGRS